MRVMVVGTGYVGLVTGTCFSEMGNNVICVDVDEAKIAKLQEGVISFYEPGLEAMLERNIKLGQLSFTNSIEKALIESDVCFIAVGTPMGEDGSADLHYVLQVASSIGKHMDHHLYVVDKSTVPVGTHRKVRDAIQNELNLRNSDLSFDVISNPEFLKEGNAIEDSLRPDRIVIGVDNDKASSVMQELYKAFVINTNTFIVMDLPSAEMTKYAANAMLATKISFINEIAEICGKTGADVNKVRLGMGSDKRIGYSFIYPGCGYGGSCFPKDISALIHMAQTNDCSSRILASVQSVNEAQKLVVADQVCCRFGGDLSELTFAVWGLAFKPETDDMREAPSIVIINELTKRGAKIKAYDPKAMEVAESSYFKGNKNVAYMDSKYSAAKNADALILITEWAEFRTPDFSELSKVMNNPIIFDGRNLYNKEQLQQHGFEHYQIGDRAIVKSCTLAI